MDNEKGKFTIFLLNLLISILSGYLVLLILGWKNLFGMANILSRYGKVGFGEYFFTALLAILVPLIMIIYFNRKIDKENVRFLSKCSIHKYGLLILYFLIIIIIPALLVAGSPEGGFIFLYIFYYMKLTIPLLIIIDLLTFSQKYIRGYKKLLPLVFFFIILLFVFFLVYFSSPKSHLGHCPLVDLNCLDSYFAEQAIKEKDLNKCNKSPVPERCLTFMASTAHNSSFCGYIPIESSFRDMCYSFLPGSECILIEEYAGKRVCMEKLCEKVVDNLTRGYCYNNIDYYIEHYNQKS